MKKGKNMKRHYVYPAVFHSEDTGFYVFFPDLKGCHTQGENIEDATLMAQEALGLYLEYLLEDNKVIPQVSLPSSLSITEKDFVAMISVDIFIYKDKANGKAIKKTLTLPAWLNEEAEKQHMNFSSVLQEALMDLISK